MALEGRELKKLLTQVVKALERSAEATENMLALATAETEATMEPGPPVCPNCGRVDPVVTQIQEGGEGRLSEFVIVGETHCCNKTVYAVPAGLDTFLHAEMAVAWMNERKGGR